MEPLQYGHYYHIFNRGNNRETLFRTDENYIYFLRLYEKYIYPIAETYAWVLMKNHFHLLVRIKEMEEININELPNSTKVSGSNSDRVSNPVRVEIKLPHLYFSNLFNSYTQAYNKMYNRTGALFQRPFKRIVINSDTYFRRLIIYIHTNPLHHGFVSDFKDYPWSSYGSILSLKPTKLSRDKVIGWFDDKANFIDTHNQTADFKEIENLIIE